MNNEATTDQTVSQTNTSEQPADQTDQGTTETGTSESSPSTESQTGSEQTTAQPTEKEAAATQTGEEQTPAPDPTEPQPLDAGTTTDTYFVSTFDTGKGSISVVHDITLGDLILSTILMAILIFMVLDRVIRR